MKAVLISIQPKWCELIASGRKTIEVRKTAPKEVPFKAYIYCTSGMLLYENYQDGNKSREIKLGNYRYARQSHSLNGKVIGEFICDKVICCQAYYGNSGEKHLTNLFGIELTQMCLTADELFNYIVGNKKEGTGLLWHIIDLKIYDKPKELGEFLDGRERPIKRAFQSWGYCNGEKN